MCKNRLSTKDILYNWGIVPDNICLLCGIEIEDRDHLFYRCIFSARVWNNVLDKCNTHYICFSWDDQIQKVVAVFYGRMLAARVGRVTFYVAVYYLLAGEK